MSDSDLGWLPASRYPGPDAKHELARNLRRAFRIDEGGSFTDLLKQIDRAHGERR